MTEGPVELMQRLHDDHAVALWHHCLRLTRHDRAHFEFLLENEFISPIGDDWYELTDKGRGAADLGEYQFEPTHRARPRSRGKAD